jgi:general secretion pathway protein G
MLLRRETHATARAGFTLMEMMIVVAIIVVLAGIGGVIYTRSLDDARKGAAKAQAKNLAEAAMQYQIKYGEYPPSLEALTQPTADGGKPFLEPSALLDPWSHAYHYVVPGPNHPSTGYPDVWAIGPANEQIGNW